MKIPKISINPFSAWGNSNLKTEYNAQKAAFNAAWQAVYGAVSNGYQTLAYWDAYFAVHPGYRSFMRYALHKSPRREGRMQLSVMEIRNGNMIPTSHTEFNNFRDFLNCVTPIGADEVMFLAN